MPPVPPARRVVDDVLPSRTVEDAPEARAERAEGGEVEEAETRPNIELLRSQPPQQSGPAEPLFTPLPLPVASDVETSSMSTSTGPGASLAGAVSRFMLLPRQSSTSTVPGYYSGLNAGPDPGTVVGITLGSVGGFLLVLWLIYTCANLGNPDVAFGFGWLGGGGRAETMVEVESFGSASVVTRQRRRSRREQQRTHRRGAPSSSRRETVEVRSARGGGGPILVEEVRGGGPRVERVVLEERTRRASGPGARRPSSRAPRVVEELDDDEIVVEEERDGRDDDEVVVIEDNTPPRRHRNSKRHSSGSRRDGNRR